MSKLLPWFSTTNTTLRGLRQGIFLFLVVSQGYLLAYLPYFFELDPTLSSSPSSLALQTSKSSSSSSSSSLLLNQQHLMSMMRNSSVSSTRRHRQQQQQPQQQQQQQQPKEQEQQPQQPQQPTKQQQQQPTEQQLRRQRKKVRRQQKQLQSLVLPYNHTFPRWGAEGIDVDALFEYIRDLESQLQLLLPQPQPQPQPRALGEEDEIPRNRTDTTTTTTTLETSIHNEVALTDNTNSSHSTTTPWNDSNSWLGNHFPETLYLWDAQGVWVSQTLRQRTSKHQIPHRVLPFELALLRAWNHLHKHYYSFTAPTSSSTPTTPTTNSNSSSNLNNNINNNNIKDRWPRLRRTIMIMDNSTNQTTEAVGFPMIAWLGDFKDCNYQNYNPRRGVDGVAGADAADEVAGQSHHQTRISTRRRRTISDDTTTTTRKSIPIFTTCAHVNCTHAFPVPTYKIIDYAQEMSRHWDAIFTNQSMRYPFHEKIRQLVWRGSLSGPLLNYTSPRSRLGVFAAQHRNSSLLNIGLTKIPRIHSSSSSKAATADTTINDNSSNNNNNLPPLDSSYNSDINLTALGGLLPPITPQADFQKYVAILDTDGNSWSSRFGSLLCSSSVIVKVEPHYVDYFYKYLQPWKHYVPVKYDLSDLMDRVQWVLDPRNAAAVQSIIGAANQWCRMHMTHASISVDILDILDAYVGYLDLHNPLWMQSWIPVKRRLMLGDGNDTGATSGESKDGDVGDHLQPPPTVTTNTTKWNLRKLDMEQLLVSLRNHKKRRPKTNDQQESESFNSSISNSSASFFPFRLQEEELSDNDNNNNSSNDDNSYQNRNSSDSSYSVAGGINQ